MIIWTGWGFLIAVVAFFCLIVTQLSVNAAMEDDLYYQMHGWPKLLGLWIAAAASWLLGRAMKPGKERHLIDTETGEEVILRPTRHSLFFIPVQYWWIIFLVLGAIFAVKS